LRIIIGMITKRLTEKIIVEQTSNHIHVQFSTPYQVLSSAVLGGGFAEASHILNLKVEKMAADTNSASISPVAGLSNYCMEHDWKGHTVGMMTAASMDSCRMTGATEGGADIIVLATTGLSNARRAGDYAEHRQIGPIDPGVGTINIICMTSLGMVPAAMIEAVITATEAKAAALQNLEIKSPVSNETATGTGTDSIVIAADPIAEKIQYCGKHVVFGEILARLVIEAVTSSIEGNCQ
jgi:adenosylcobinamide amidohydrolase